MILTIEVRPNARETKVISQKDAQTYVIDVNAQPIEGAANRELISFLSKKLNVAKTLIEIKRGQGSRVKHVHLPDKTPLSLLTK